MSGQRQKERQPLTRLAPRLLREYDLDANAPDHHDLQPETSTDPTHRCAPSALPAGCALPALSFYHLTAQVEDFFAALPEMLPLLQDHWEELGTDRDQVPLEPRWDDYRALYDKGQLLLVTLRERGRLVGYSWTIVAPGLHYGSTLHATSDIYRILPEYRGRMGGRRLFRAVEAELRRRGVKRWLVGSKLHRDCGRLLTAVGLKPHEVWYSKLLGDSPW